jgi:hypothetical protein
MATDAGTIEKVQGFGFSRKIWGFTLRTTCNHRYELEHNQIIDQAKNKF